VWQLLRANVFITALFQANSDGWHMHMTSQMWLTWPRSWNGTITPQISHISPWITFTLQVFSPLVVLFSFVARSWLWSARV